MSNKQDKKKRLKNAKIDSKAISGSKFDDLTEAEMEEVQGQGDQKKPQKRGIWDIFTSEGKYNCR